MSKAQPRQCLSPSAAYWTRRYGREVSEEEARAIVESVVEFFRTLHKWDAAEKKRVAEGKTALRSPSIRASLEVAE